MPLQSCLEEAMIERKEQVSVQVVAESDGPMLRICHKDRTCVDYPLRSDQYIRLARQLLNAVP